MSELAALCYSAGALLLLIGGALKVVDPSGSSGALHAMGVPVGNGLVRVVAGAEMLLGALGLAAAGRVVALLIAASYVGFAILTGVALARGTPIDSCGCLGRLETPPGAGHLVVIGVALAGALAEVADPAEPALERLTGDGVAGVLFALGTLALTALGVVLFRTGRRPVAQ